MPLPLALASASPRRRDLLAQIGVTPDAIAPSHTDETPQPGESARTLAARLAREKAAACPLSDHLVLAADTVVAVGRRILPKAETRNEAHACLSLLSGRAHQVWTAVAVRAPVSGEPDAAPPREADRLVMTRVIFKRLTEHEIAAYLDSQEWAGKAGGYAIQGRAAAFVAQLSGSYTGVVGLPLYETANLLEGFGYPVRAAGLASA